MAAVTICSDFGAPQNKVWHCFHCFSIYFPWSDGTWCHIFVFWMLSSKPTFSLSSFTFIKRLLSSSSLSAIRVVSSAYVSYWYFSWQSWFQLVLLPAPRSSWCSLHRSWISTPYWRTYRSFPIVHLSAHFWLFPLAMFLEMKILSQRECTPSMLSPHAVPRHSSKTWHQFLHIRTSPLLHSWEEHSFLFKQCCRIWAKRSSLTQHRQEEALKPEGLR